MRFTELIQTFPLFFAVVILVALVGPNVFNVMAVIGFLSWPGLARLIRGQVLSLRAQQFVESARAMGAGGTRIVSRHVLPGVLPYLAVYAALALAQAILTEAALSFLGLGVQMPIPSWGGMMNSAQALTVLESQPWLWIRPAWPSPSPCCARTTLAMACGTRSIRVWGCADGFFGGRRAEPAPVLPAVHGRARSRRAIGRELSRGAPA